MVNGFRLLLLLSVCFLCLAMVRDPTEPSGELGQLSVQTVDGFNLQAILISNKRKLAFINDHYLAEGDPILGASVKKIAKNKVVLSLAGQDITLFLIANNNWKTLIGKQ